MDLMNRVRNLFSLSNSQHPSAPLPRPDVAPAPTHAYAMVHHYVRGSPPSIQCFRVRLDEGGRLATAELERIMSRVMRGPVHVPAMLRPGAQPVWYGHAHPLQRNVLPPPGQQEVKAVPEVKTEKAQQRLPDIRLAPAEGDDNEGDDSVRSPVEGAPHDEAVDAAPSNTARKEASADAETFEEAAIDEDQPGLPCPLPAATNPHPPRGPRSSLPVAPGESPSRSLRDRDRQNY